MGKMLRGKEVKKKKRDAMTIKKRILSKNESKMNEQAKAKNHNGNKRTEQNAIM